MRRLLKNLIVQKSYACFQIESEKTHKLNWCNTHFSYIPWYILWVCYQLIAALQSIECHRVKRFNNNFLQQTFTFDEHQELKRHFTTAYSSVLYGTDNYSSAILEFETSLFESQLKPLTLIRGFLGPSPSVISGKKFQNHHWWRHS